LRAARVNARTDARSLARVAGSSIRSTSASYQ
jgi:hypothetical protein